MRPPSRKLIYTDFIIQVLMLVPLLFVSLGSIVNGEAALLAAFIQFFLGIWQTLSSLYTNLLFRLKSRRIHLLICLVFFLLFFFGYQFGDMERLFKRSFYPVIYLFFIVPQLIAIYYARVTFLDYKNLEIVEKGKLIEKDLEGDILDAGMVGKE